MTIKALLFDKDGTLLDYHQTWAPLNRVAALHVANGDQTIADQLLAHAGQDPKTNIVRPGSHLAAGTTVEIAAAFEQIHPHHGHGDLAQLLDTLFLDDLVEQTTAVAGLNAAIDGFVQRGLILGLVTSDSQQGAEISLSPFGILEEFDYVCGYDSGPAPKPDAAPALAFCQHVGVNPGEIAVVGDNYHDMAMGKAAGAGLNVGVLTGTSGHDELSQHADVVLDSICDLEACLISRQLI